MLEGESENVSSAGKSFEIKIENVVASVTLGVPVPLKKLTPVMNTEYDPTQFPGLVYRIQDPKAAALIFGSGKIICTGARSPELANVAIKKIVGVMRESGLEIPEEYGTKVENIVASAKMEKELNLNSIALSLENAEYEPEQFPGLVYRIDDPKVAFLLFGSGKIVCTGGKDIGQVENAIRKISRKLKEIEAYN